MSSASAGIDEWAMDRGRSRGRWHRSWGHYGLWPTSRSTLQRVEAGDPAVSIGIYAAVMHSLGLLNGLGQLADLSSDPVGQAMANESLPHRIRLKPGKDRT